MPWMKLRQMWVGGYTAYEWRYLGPNDQSVDAVEELAEAIVEEIECENEWSDKFRKVEYEVLDTAPMEVVEKHILDTERSIEWSQGRLSMLKAELSRSAEVAEKTG